ncbi:MAG: RNA polymerase sigma factor [Candidatus Limnocylindrales bacterium]
MDTTSDLLADLAADLDGAFAALVVAEQDLVYGIALRSTRDPGAAEELAQDAFVRAYRALATYDGQRIRELQLRAWLARITINLGRNRARSRRAAPAEVALESVAEPMDPGLHPEPAALAREAEAEWSRRLAALPQRYRLAVELRHVHGLSYAEIAEALQRPLNTTKTHIHRGVALLRSAYIQETAR